MSDIVKDIVREVKDFWRQHSFRARQQFKKDWERYFLFRVGATAVLITAVLAFVGFWVWLIYSHALIAALLIWGGIGLFVIVACFVFVYNQIDKAVKR